MKHVCLEAPSVCACNLRRPEMTVLRVRNIFEPFAGWKGEGCLSQLHHFSQIYQFNQTEGQIKTDELEAKTREH